MKKLLLSFSTLLVLSLSANNTTTIKTPKSVSAVGEALNFDGTNDFVKSSGYTAFTQYTFEGWFKLNNLNDQCLIVGTNAGGPAGAFSQCLILQSGNFVNYVYDGNARQIASTVQPTVGVWYHVAGSAKNGSTMKIVVNNIETVSTFSIGNMWNGLTAIVLGQPFSGSNYFNGSMDEVRYWNRQLCLGEILNNMNGEITTSTPNLITNFHFNEGVGNSTNTGITSLPDASGANHNGTLTNFSLTGTTSNWIEPSTIASGSAITTYSAPIVTIAGTNTVCSGVATTFTASGATTYNWTSGPATSTYSIIPSASATYSVVGFVNNCPSNVATLNLTVLPSPTVNITDAYVCAGSSYTFTPTGANSYTYSSESNVITPTANSTATISGTSTLGCTSSKTISVFVQPCGQNGSSLNFDGVNDNVTTPITLNETTYQNWTFECWVNSPQAPTTTLGLDGPMYADNMGILWNHNTGFFGSAFVLDAGGNYNAASFGPMQANTWYHLTATYNGTVLKTYKNGVLSNSVTSIGGGLSAPATTFKIGRHPSVGHYFEGKIDEVRIWNTVRTCSEINQTMNTELNGNETGLQAYYKFNEGAPNSNNSSITNIINSTVNSFNGSLNSFSLTGNSSNYFLGAPFNNTTNPLCLTTDLNELNNHTSFLVYPNPTSSILNIEVKEQTQISIINILGHIVKTETINGAGKLDVSALNSGVYFIQDSKSGKAIKFIKE